MSDYTVVSLKKVENMFEARGWPGEMKFLSKPLNTTQVAVSYRRMPQNSGGKGGYGHKHKTQEELVYIINGRLQLKLDEEIVEIKRGQVIRIAPEVVRSFWNAEPEDVELLIISTLSDGLKEDTEMIKDFWPA